MCAFLVFEGKMVRRISFQDTTVFTAMSQPLFECDFAFETNETMWPVSVNDSLN